MSKRRFRRTAVRQRQETVGGPPRVSHVALASLRPRLCKGHKLRIAAAGASRGRGSAAPRWLNDRSQPKADAVVCLRPHQKATRPDSWCASLLQSVDTMKGTEDSKDSRNLALGVFIFLEVTADLGECIEKLERLKFRPGQYMNRRERACHKQKGKAGEPPDKQKING